MKTAREICELLKGRVHDVAEYLLPNGSKQGSEWCVGSIHGEPGKSLGVCLTGSKAGIWSDFADGSKEGSGDLLDLWCQVRNISLIEAMKEASRYLGIDSITDTLIRPKVDFNRPLKDFGTLMSHSQTVVYLMTERKLKLSIIQDFKIGEHIHSAVGPCIVFPYIRDGKTLFIKYLALARVNGKKQIAAEKDCEPCLFGWHLVSNSARKIAICEGEIDAMSLRQYGIEALSVPFGGGVGNKHKWLEYEYERLSVFDEIYLCFDNDEEGIAASHDIASRLGNYRCKIVTLPHKDANMCLQLGVSQEEILKCFEMGVSLDPAELKDASLYAQGVIDLFYPPDGQEPGYTLPWKATHDKMLMRPGDLTVWTGINGHGKSQALGHAILHWISLGARICIASLELKPTRLLMRMTKQASAISQPSKDYIHAIHEWYKSKLLLFDLVGTAKSERLLEVFKYCRQRYGVDIFVIDSMMKLDIAEDDYKGQKALMEKLCDFKNQYSCHIHIVVHPRKSMDETRVPGKLDNKGTGAISDLADNCVSIWRNKRKEEVLKHLENEKRKEENKDKEVVADEKQKAIIDKPDGFLTCDKQRNGEWEGSVGLWFDKASYQYLDGETGHAKRYVPHNGCG